jgi:hypothetical protein
LKGGGEGNKTTTMERVCHDCGCSMIT